jgi:Asp-tRNA(Asn)/Glu-tRNA(Gln) amidotransferase A subunit family amidase
LRARRRRFGLRGECPDAVLDAPHVAHLRAAGAVPIGRGNLPDLALRRHTESARYGTTLNQWDAALSPGGSSGGDAVAVATGMVPFAVGSDYGGSLRVPAALAGVYALRPTPGRVAQVSSVPPSMSRQLFPRLRAHGCAGTLRFVEGLLSIAAPLDGPGSSTSPPT